MFVRQSHSSNETSLGLVIATICHLIWGPGIKHTSYVEMEIWDYWENYTFVKHEKVNCATRIK